MNYMKNIGIGTQLKFAFAVILLFVIAIGIVSHLQTEEMVDQLRIIYKHPVEVSKAVANVESGIIKIHRNMKDLFIAENEAEISQNLNEIVKLKKDVDDNIDILSSLYLGPKEDIDQLGKNFAVWNSMREETIRMFRAGQIKEAASRTTKSGTAGEQVEILMKDVDKISRFAEQKMDELYSSAETSFTLLNIQLAFFMAAILVLTIVLMTLILRNIRNPLTLLTETTRKFRNGDMSARSLYESKNEFGVLSSALNDLAETIHKEMVFRENAAAISAAMMAEIESQNFRFRVLSPLMELTGSQIGAIYLINDEKKEYYPVETIGLEVSNCKSFSATEMDGEFGRVLVTREICLINDIPEDTTFNFAATSGTFRPAEIMTVPLIIGNEISAVISFANIRKFSPEAIRLIHGLQNPLSTGMSAMLANRRIQKLTEELEYRNMELEAQKNELESQATELHSQNTELEMQKTRLDEANRLKTNFLSNMSHELRTPLNSVIALSGVLNRRLAGKIPEDEYSYLGVIERNGKNLLDLINDILDISRIEAGKEEIEITRFNMCDIGNDVVSLIKPQADEKGIKLLKTVDECNIQIESDERKCRHILQNLIGNAVKFTEEGTVEIIVNKDAVNIEIKIKDTGIGISEKNLPYIFDEFRQADGSTSRRFGGTGLGLAIAKKYAEMLGGSISVKSELGRGSDFTLILPLRYFEKLKKDSDEKSAGREF
jgi:signal transduction histidine kinase/HAMP domain-containing protein